jgi:hypothetical protein
MADLECLERECYASKACENGQRQGKRQQNDLNFHLRPPVPFPKKAVQGFFHMQLRRWRLEIIQHRNEPFASRRGFLNFLFRAP